MDQHVKLLGVLYILFGCFSLCIAFLVLLFFGGVTGLLSIAAEEQPEALLALPIVGAIAGFLVLFALAMALPRIVAGYGLLRYRPWGRLLALVLAVIGLINFPFGTVLGLYALWVLLSQTGSRLFDPVPAAPPPGPPSAPPVV